MGHPLNPFRPIGVVLDYSQVADIYSEEHSSPQLAKVPANFYEKLRQLIAEKKREVVERFTKGEDELVVAELRRLLFFQKAILQKRMEKIFFHAARGTRPENMTEEEERLFEALLRLREAFSREIYTGEEMKLTSPLEEVERELAEREGKERGERPEGREEGGEKGESQKAENGEGSKEEHMVQVLITEYVEAYRGLDGNIYGPYKEGEKVKLPKEEGEWLVMAGMAKRIGGS